MRHIFRIELAHWTFTVVMIGCAGCSSLRVPAFDPTGERIFAPGSTALVDPTGGSLSESCILPKPAWSAPPTPPPCPPGEGGLGTPICDNAAGCFGAGLVPNSQHSRTRGFHDRVHSKRVPGELLLSPGRLIAPVGSEVILVAGLCGDNGHYVMRQPLEWMLSRDSVGHFVDVNERCGLALGDKSEKFGPDYAVAQTGTRAEILDRGTRDSTDDVFLQKGQGWLSLTSASEGTSRVAVLASRGTTWSKRQKTATVEWIDAQWALPAPAVVAAGQPLALETLVTRNTNGTPLTDWIVRYEVTDSSASFAGGQSAAEVMTDADGRGVAQLLPATLGAATTQVAVQIIRPANSISGRTVVGTGATTVRWSAPAVQLQATGPSIGTVDALLTYRLEISNPGDLVARQVIVRETQRPPGLEFVSSSVDPNQFGDRLQWTVGDLAPGATRVIEVNCRATTDANFRYAFRAESADGIVSEAFVETNVVRETMQLKLRLEGSPDREVGETVTFVAEITNTGNRPLDNLTLVDQFGEGLGSSRGASPLRLTLPNYVQPGQTQEIEIQFRLLQVGRQCHTLTVTSGGGQSQQTTGCVNVLPARPSANASLQMKLKGPTTLKVRQEAEYTMDVVNNGNVDLTNVEVALAIDNAIEPFAVTQPGIQGQDAEGIVRWFFPRIAAGQTQEVGFTCRGRQADPTAEIRVVVTSAEATQAASAAAEDQLTVNVTDDLVVPDRGNGPIVPDRPLEPPTSNRTLISISDARDPLAVNGQASYEITIKNDRDVSDRNVIVRILPPAGLRDVRVDAESRNLANGLIELIPIAEIRAGESVSIRVTGTASQVGTLRLGVSVVSARGSDPVTATEDTVIFNP